MNILYIGSVSSHLSLIPFQTLINSKHTVCALAIDDYDLASDFNVINADSIQSLALDNSIPLIKLNKNYTDAISVINSYQADVILVSCYARLLPQSIISIAIKGCFNVHPSLLPCFRGPTPLFWQFRQGIKDFGVSIHKMTSEFDAGNILCQKTVNMPDGINNYDANKLLAEMASELLLSFLDDVENECVTEIVQNNQYSSYQSYPTESDYSVSTSWPAKRIYNFINAYKGSGITFLCEVNGEEYKLIDAYSYQEESYYELEGKPMHLENNIITFACKNSNIRCELEP